MTSLLDLQKKGLIATQDLELLQQVAEKFSVAITPHILSQITNTDSDGLKKQFIPEPEELTISPQESIDPIGDKNHSPIKGLVHRYPDRVLLMPVSVCPIYCRFCFRREKVGVGNKALTPNELESCYDYIHQHNDIWEVILSGGDPLILKPQKLKNIIERLDIIKHVEIIRLHTRVPVVDPKRINHDMLQTLTLRKPIYIILHINHPDELTPEAIKVINILADAGIPLLSQSVLLKNINDNFKVLNQLMRLFIRHRIKPYYLHHGDLAQGTQHFRTTIKEGQQLMRMLQGNLSGLCQPNFVLDIPGGHGKAPIGPSYINCDNNQYIIEDYQGNYHNYFE